MRNEEQRLFAVGMPDAEETTSTAEKVALRQEVRGVAGQLRPYRDVRSGFEPWRRLARLAWPGSEESLSVH